MKDELDDRRAAEALAGARRVVVKIGSALLVDRRTGLLDQAWLESLTEDLQRLRARGQDVLVVSSGAIALGRRYLGIDRSRRRLEELQAAAAAGQVMLAHAYQETLGGRDMQVAQVLLILDDTENRRRYLNARSTLQTLLELGVIPVVNENDTVATQEIRYGDNDRLAARVAEMIGADCLVLLSDVDGLYDADPATSPAARLIPAVQEITPQIEGLAGEAQTDHGTGGMVTKVAAARIAVAAGCATLIAGGRGRQPLQAVESGGSCTWFAPHGSPQSARKRWIAGSLEPRGTVVIDGGAERALRSGRSLLPVGVMAVDGTFERGDAITVRTGDGRDIARGLAAYSSEEIHRIRGRRTGSIGDVLGYRGRDEVIHRDNLSLLDPGTCT